MNSEVEFFISDKKIKLEDEDGNYIFWVAFLNSENEENERSIRTMYGYTELIDRLAFNVNQTLIKVWKHIKFQKRITLSSTQAAYIGVIVKAGVDPFHIT